MLSDEGKQEKKPEENAKMTGKSGHVLKNTK